MKRYLLILLTAFFLIQGCDQKFNTDQLVSANSGNGNITGDTVYIQLNPAWEGFNNPQDIMIGREPFIYIADTDNNRVVMMNLNGDILGTRKINHPIALAQDYRLNLFVCAKLDTVISGDTVSAVFKLNMLASQHNIANATIDTILPRLNQPLDPGRVYSGVAVFYDNSYFVSRTGPHNSTLIDPDNSILSFTGEDIYKGRVGNIDPIGSGVLSAYGISSISSFNKSNYDVITTLIGNTNFKVQWLHFVDTRDYTGYQNYISPQSSEIMRPNRFERPEGVTLDNSQNIIVVDMAKDSVYRFNPFGDLLQSFGGTEVFDSPAGVAFFNKTLYIADSGNNRILRFILSTDIR
ncbi:MAG TPA: hypothetical protein VLB50_09005 [Ignavibacteriaceae bacterium]|nr:hypothetical protein [Ignavibacteriaceae bacterium]